MTGDQDTATLERIVFAPNFVLGRPTAIAQNGTAGVAIDMNGLVRAIQLVSETDSGVDQDIPSGVPMCYKWGDVCNVVGMRLSELFSLLGARRLVLAFDHFTPPAKRPVQDKRRARASASKMLNNRPPYHFPPTSDRRLDAWFNDDMDVEATWSEVFYNPTARLRVQEYIVRWLVEKYTMPVDTSLLIEGAVLGGRVRAHPVEIVAASGTRVVVRSRADLPPRHTYSEADIRVVHWAQWMADSAPPDQPVVVEERDADVLNALLLLEHSRVRAGKTGAPIYMKRTRSVWNDRYSRRVKVPEYVHIGGLYMDITLLFGALMTQFAPADYHTEPIELFMSLVLMRGDDYCPPLAYCTVMSTWSALFSHPRRVVSWVESDPRPEGTDDAVPTRIALHYTAARNFVDLCYECVQRERGEKAAAAAAVRAAAKGTPPASSSSRKRAAPSKPKRAPQGWPDQRQLQLLLARQCWQLDMLANARRPGCYAENEMRRDPVDDDDVLASLLDDAPVAAAAAAASSSSAAASSSSSAAASSSSSAAASSSSSSSSSAADGTVSFYGWERDASGNVCYAERVKPREVFVVQRPHDPVRLTFA